MSARRLLVALGALVVVLIVAAVVIGVTGRDGDAEVVRGVIFGSVEDLDGAGVDGAEVSVTVAASGEELGTSASDALGLFEVEVGDHDGPVVVRAAQGDRRAATVVALRSSVAPTGVRLVVGGPGDGSLGGRVVAPDGGPVDQGGVVEARFVETARSEVAVLDASGGFQFDALPLDGDLILVATMAGGGRQGLAASVVTESMASNSTDVVLGAALGEGSANEVEDPDIVTEGLTGWSTDGDVSVVRADEDG